MVVMEFPFVGEGFPVVRINHDVAELAGRWLTYIRVAWPTLAWTMPPEVNSCCNDRPTRDMLMGWIFWFRQYRL